MRKAALSPHHRTARCVVHACVRLKRTHKDYCMALRDFAYSPRWHGVFRYRGVPNSSSVQRCHDLFSLSVVSAGGLENVRKETRKKKKFADTVYNCKGSCAFAARLAALVLYPALPASMIDCVDPRWDSKQPVR